MIMIGLIDGVVIFIFHFPGHVQQHMQHNKVAIQLPKRKHEQK